MATQSNKEA